MYKTCVTVLCPKETAIHVHSGMDLLSSMRFVILYMCIPTWNQKRDYKCLDFAIYAFCDSLYMYTYEPMWNRKQDHKCLDFCSIVNIVYKKAKQL